MSLTNKVESLNIVKDIFDPLDNFKMTEQSEFMNVWNHANLHEQLAITISDMRNPIHLALNINYILERIKLECYSIFHATDNPKFEYLHRINTKYNGHYYSPECKRKIQDIKRQLTYISKNIHQNLLRTKETGDQDEILQFHGNDIRSFLEEELQCLAVEIRIGIMEVNKKKR